MEIKSNIGTFMWELQCWKVKFNENMKLGARGNKAFNPTNNGEELRTQVFHDL